MGEWRGGGAGNGAGTANSLSFDYANVRIVTDDVRRGIISRLARNASSREAKASGIGFCRREGNVVLLSRRIGLSDFSGYPDFSTSVEALKYSDTLIETLLKAERPAGRRRKINEGLPDPFTLSRFIVSLK